MSEFPVFGRKSWENRLLSGGSAGIYAARRWPELPETPLPRREKCAHVSNTSYSDLLLYTVYCRHYWFEKEEKIMTTIPALKGFLSHEKKRSEMNNNSRCKLVWKHREGDDGKE